jgi:hypothetical protein
MAMTSVNGRWTGPAGVFPCVRAGLVLVVALELVAPALANAQVRVGTPDELPGILGPGDLISVVHTGGVSVRGRVLRLGDTDLDIRTDTREPSGQQRHLDVKIPLAAIQSLERPRDPLRNGVLIGAAVGAGCVGAMFGYAVAVDRNEIDEWAPIYLAYAALSTGIGALVGWAVDSGNSKPHVRFDRRSTATTTVRVTPLLSRKPGLAVVVAF